MLGLPRIVQAYNTVLLQYKKAEGFTLGFKGIRHRKNKKAQGKTSFGPLQTTWSFQTNSSLPFKLQQTVPPLKWASRTSLNATTDETCCQTHVSLSNVLPR